MLKAGKVFWTLLDISVAKVSILHFAKCTARSRSRQGFV